MVSTYQIVLGTTSLEITPEDVALNASELIPKSQISGVFPMTFQERQVGDTDWTYPYDTITRITIYLKNGRKLEVELQSVTNQSGWSGGTLADLQQAIADINPWLLSSFPPPPPYLVVSNGTTLISTITGLGFTAGDTPPQSALFGIFADGLLPVTGNITITSSSSNLQFWNGVSFQSTPLTFPYTGGAVNMGLTGTVRLNPACTANTYNETLTLSSTAVNVTSWVINCSGVVAPADYIQFTTDATVTTSGDFYILKGTASGYLDISALSTIGSRNDYDIEMGAGGAGGSPRGGGGAGGIIKTTITATVGNFPFVIGSGGTGGTSPSVKGTNGGNTTFNGLTAIGGGAGGLTVNTAANIGNSGGSGGGGSCNASGNNFFGPGLGTVGQGNNGGVNATAPYYRGGGGGGAGAVGVSGLVTGNGGVGLLSAIDGNWYGGGGGAGSNGGGTISTGGIGGGGNGSINATAAQNGTANTSGGGGGAGTVNGGNGGSGFWIAKIRKSG